MSATSRTLLGECKEIARTRLAEVVAAALKKIDEDLFQLADKTLKRQEQQVYLDAMGKVREHRSTIERSFDTCFADLFDKRMQPAPRQAAANDWGGVELSLVSHSKIEGGIAIDRLAKSIKKAAGDDELLGIQARLAHLLDKDSLQDSENPLSPELIFEALKLACHEIPAAALVKQAVLAAFEPYLRASINDVYRAINQNLVAHHILPQIRHSVQPTNDPMGRSGRSATLGQSQRMAAMAQSQRMGLLNADRVASASGERTGWLGGTTDGNAGGNGSGSSASNSGRTVGGAAGGATEDRASTQGASSLGYLLTGLAQGLAGARMEAVSMFADPLRFPVGPGAVPASTALLASLSRLQDQTDSAVNDAGDAPFRLRQIDRALVAQGTPLDQLTLELVTVVFDFLLAKPTLPETVKGALSRLQIVAIKAALLDRSFFARRDHPMRRLLDAIAEAGADPSVDCHDDGPFMQQLRVVIDGLCNDFRDDCSVFEAATGALASLRQTQAAASDAAVLPEAQSLAETEADIAARAAAQADIALRLNESTPPFIREFLTAWWAEAITLAERTGGGDEHGAHARLGLASDLVWSVAPKSPADVATLATMLPVLVRGLMQGTLDVGMPEAARTEFFNSLMAAHTAGIALAKRATPDLETTPRPSVAEALRRAPVETAVPADNYAQQVAGLTKGDLVEFSDEHAGERFKLGWVSPKRSFFVFLGHGRMRQLSATQLSAFFRQGVAVQVAPDAPVIDQAIDAMSLDFSAMPVAA